MADAFFAALRQGGFRLPDSAINYGNSPLPIFPPGAMQFIEPDGQINKEGGNLLPGGLLRPYAFGTSARISTQTQMAHPNKVALIIPKLRIPASESHVFDGGDPVLEHALSDGDLVFTFKMGPDMSGYGNPYCEAPYGHAAKAVPLLNLATVNYILWGLQVGIRQDKGGRRWRDFFYKLTQSQLDEFRSFFFGPDQVKESLVWNFIKSYLMPFGVQHGGDQQGGLHEGNSNSVVTHGATDYVSSFAVEGRLQHINNLWRDYDVHENDDLILALRYRQGPSPDIHFNLSSSVRATRTERVRVSSGYFYLRPETLGYRTFSDCCYVHVGRSFKYCSQFTRGGLDACCWDARVPVIPGAPIMLTFEPGFVDSDDIYYESLDSDDDDGEEEGGTKRTMKDDDEDNNDNQDPKTKKRKLVPDDEPEGRSEPTHALRPALVGARTATQFEPPKDVLVELSESSSSIKPPKKGEGKKPAKTVVVGDLIRPSPETKKSSTTSSTATP